MIEKVFLGCLMKESFLIKETCIRPEQLQETIHQEIFKRMIEFEQSGKMADLLTLTTIPYLESYGGVTYLADLQSHAAIDQFGEVEELIFDSWKEREKKHILKLAELNNWEIDEIMSQLDKLQVMKTDDYHSIAECLTEIYEAPWMEQEQMAGVQSGIEVLDKLTGGWQDGEVTILAPDHRWEKRM